MGSPSPVVVTAHGSMNDIAAMAVAPGVATPYGAAASPGISAAHDSPEPTSPEPMRAGTQGFAATQGIVAMAGAHGVGPTHGAPAMSPAKSPVKMPPGESEELMTMMLVPLRSGAPLHGLLHLNDVLRDRLSARELALWSATIPARTPFAKSLSGPSLHALNLAFEQLTRLHMRTARCCSHRRATLTSLIRGCL